MTDDERAALVNRALLAHMDFFGADAFTGEARDAMCVVVAIIEDAIRADERARVVEEGVSPLMARQREAMEAIIRADERARVVAEATTDEAVERASKALHAAKRPDAFGWAAAIRAALGAGE
jgi:formylmethanofuran dehydrogenase subunit B